jgi:hypothetical protein
VTLGENPEAGSSTGHKQAHSRRMPGGSPWVLCIGVPKLAFSVEGGLMGLPVSTGASPTVSGISRHVLLILPRKDPEPLSQVWGNRAMSPRSGSDAGGGPDRLGSLS